MPLKGPLDNGRCNIKIFLVHVKQPKVERWTLECITQLRHCQENTRLQFSILQTMLIFLEIYIEFFFQRKQVSIKFIGYQLIHLTSFRNPHAFAHNTNILEVIAMHPPMHSCWVWLTVVNIPSFKVISLTRLARKSGQSIINFSGHGHIGFQI